MSELARLGIRTGINATGPWTMVGNAAPAPHVRAAMDEMAANYAPIAELQELASGVIAQVTGSRAGYVTPGAAAAVTLSVAACLAGEDPDRIRALPHLAEPLPAALPPAAGTWSDRWRCSTKTSTSGRRSPDPTSPRTT